MPHQLARITGMLDPILDDGYGLDIIYLDYRKAFDSVLHKRLIEKLKTWNNRESTIMD